LREGGVYECQARRARPADQREAAATLRCTVGEREVCDQAGECRGALMCASCQRDLGALAFRV